MKKILFSFLIVTTFFAFSTKSMAQTDKKNVIKLNLFSPILRSVSLFYERELSDKMSAQIGAFFTGVKFGDTKFSGFGVTPELRFYLGDKGTPEGFFVAPFLRYQNFNLTAKLEDSNTNETIEGEATLSALGGGLLVGSQWIFSDIISLDLWAGPAYSSTNLKVKEGKEDDFSIGNFSGFGFRFGLTLGVAF